MSEIKSLMANRGYIKGSFRRLSKFCESDEIKTCSYEILQEKRSRFSAAFNDYELQNKAILVLEPNDKEDYGEYEDLYYQGIAVLDHQLKKRQPVTASVTDLPTSASGEFKKLPKITIQTFDGKNVVDYYPFINLFRAVIHSDKKLSACEKLYYLRSLLSGEALDIIKNLPLNDVSYGEALMLLENRYANTSKIVNFHVNSMLDLPTFTRCTAINLRSIISNVTMHLAALKNLEQPVQHWDTLLVNILAKKVDNYTVRGFHLDRNSKEVPTFSEFLSLLEKRAMAQENTGEDGLVSNTTSPSMKAPKSMKARIKDRECITLLEERLEELQRGSRKTNIEIKNVPKINSEDKEHLINMVLCLGKSVDCNINKFDVRDIYRVRENKDGQKNTPIV
ncbi:Uncharacterized protein OBRU01_10652, partial [Operophtera brumata]